MSKFVFSLSLLLIVVFLVRNIIPSFSYENLFYNILSVGIVIFILFQYCKENSSVLSLYNLFFKSLLIGIFSGFICALFFYVYAEIIDPEYFNNIGRLQINEYKNKGLDEYNIRRNLSILGVIKKYHLNEISFIASTAAKSLAASLIITPFIKDKN